MDRLSKLEALAGGGVVIEKNTSTEADNPWPYNPNAKANNVYEGTDSEDEEIAKMMSNTGTIDVETGQIIYKDGTCQLAFLSRLVLFIDLLSRQLRRHHQCLRLRQPSTRRIGSRGSPLHAIQDGYEVPVPIHWPCEQTEGEYCGGFSCPYITDRYLF